MKNHEKLYKESLDKIQEVLNNAKKQGHIVVRVEDLENTFHELKETEDERIRNAISYAIGNSTHEDGTLINGVTESEAMAWLEKQGEQKPINYADEEIVEAVKDTSVLDMVEPKFKAGDWVVDILYDEAMQVLFLEDDGYEFDNGIWVSYTDAKERVHLWTIQDAKDGDVLQLGRVTAIFKEYIGNGTCGCYCSVCKGEFEIPADDGFDNVYGCYDTHPATQEQRDLLFQKMKEAGYEWDAEKKEVKKIHVIDEGKAEMDYCFTKMMNGEKINPAWSEEDERMCNASIRACQYMVENFENSTWDYEDAIDWLKSIKNKVQPKQEWSEEDKGNLLDVKCIIDEIWHCQYVRGEIDCSCEELESLWSWLDDIWQKVEYPSSTWKPSEEQIRALEYQVHSTYQGSWQYKASKELLEQLKKL